MSIVILAGLVAVPAFAQDCEREATNMAQFRDCAARNMDQRLSSELNKTLAYVRARDRQAAELLEIAQGSWEKFVNDSCAYTIAARQTDEMANDARLACRQSFADARIRILAAYRHEFGKAP